MVDVTVRTQIAVPPERVAAIMFDPTRDAEWIGGAKRSEVLGPFPYGVGTSVRREGSFLGRSFSWTTEVVEFARDRSVRMKHVVGPFNGGVDYTIARASGGSEVAIRNYGEASFRFPFMGTMMRMSVAADLRRLKKLAESQPT